MFWIILHLFFQKEKNIHLILITFIIIKLNIVLKYIYAYIYIYTRVSIDGLQKYLLLHSILFYEALGKKRPQNCKAVNFLARTIQNS